MIRRVARGEVPAAARLQALDAATRQNPWTLPQWEMELNHPQAFIWVVRTDNERWAGFLVLRVAAGVGELLQIAVHPAMRRRGLALEMLEHACAAETGASEIWLEVRAGNCAAIELYRRAGFSETGRRRRYYSNPEEDAMLLSLPLGL